jgi:hypothetical protein
MAAFLKQGLKNIQGDALNSALQSAMSGIATPELAQSTAPPVEIAPIVSDAEKKKAVLAEYCRIVKQKELGIRKLFQESIANYFADFRLNDGNKKTIQEFMFNNIFNIVQQSITADNNSIKSFISAIISNGTINHVLYEPFKKETINGVNSDEAIIQIIEKLREPTEPVKNVTYGGHDSGNSEKIEEILNWFPSNEDRIVVNDKILNMILLAFGRELEKSKKFIYKTITNVIEQKIGTAISDMFKDGNWFHDEQLVRTVLYNILSNNANNDIIGLFKGAFKTFIEGIKNKTPEFIVGENIKYEKLNELLLDAFILPTYKTNVIVEPLPEASSNIVEPGYFIHDRYHGGRKNKTRKPKITRKKRTKRRHTKKA